MNKHVSKAFGVLFLLLELAIVPKAVELMLDRPLSELSAVGIIGLSMTFGSIALCILMSFTSISENESHPLTTFLFELTVFLCCAAPITELVTEALEDGGRPGLNLFVNTVFYLVGVSIAYIILLYELLVIDNRDRPALKLIRRIASILMIAETIATILNIRFGFFFTITEAGAYRSAPTFWLAYIAPAVIIAATVFVAAKEMEPGRRRRAFFCFWIFAVSASLLQGFFNELTVQYTGYTLSLIVIYINVQSELDNTSRHKTGSEDSEK